MKVDFKDGCQNFKRQSCIIIISQSKTWESVSATITQSFSSISVKLMELEAFLCLLKLNVVAAILNQDFTIFCSVIYEKFCSLCRQTHSHTNMISFSDKNNVFMKNASYKPQEFKLLWCLVERVTFLCSQNISACSRADRSGWTKSLWSKTLPVSLNFYRRQVCCSNDSSIT